MRIDDDEPVRPPLPRGISREGRHTLVACLVLVALFALVAVFGNSIVALNGPGGMSASSGRAGTVPGDGQRAGSATQDSDDDLRTGSILFVPDHGNVCRKHVIDNRTWRIQSAGTVLCNEAVSWNANSAGNRISPLARIEAIREGFQQKKP